MTSINSAFSLHPLRAVCMGMTLLIGGVAAQPLLAQTAENPAPARFAYVGTYNPNGEGVYLMKVDPASGALSKVKTVSTLPNAAQMVMSADGNVLYVASEVADYQGGKHGSLAAYKVNRDNGDLTLLNQADSQGAGPVYLSLTPDGKHLLVANYISGSIAVFPVESDGKIGAPSAVKQSEGPAGAAKPEAAVPGSFAISDHNGPHAHMIASDPSGKFVFSTDLGLDRIYQWRFDAEKGTLMANNPPYIMASSAGAGPRHFVFHPDGKTVYLINEEASTLTQYSFDKQSGTLKEVATQSSLPETYQGTSFAAGLVLSHDGHFLYVANRLRNSIMQFAVGDEGKLSKVAEVWTGGDYPRTLTLDPTGRYLYALNQRSDNIMRFSRDPQSGRLTMSDDVVGVGAPSQMVFGH
ncbi:lactonase family protein [Enterobacillus tribolii]|uniref:6-phosphogluconolactonase (Cycloisomerase 2 family) n=1 Tax=Enterobacillus tribolii TaxID=1487935 RepID=A0A370QQP1_9GAMM|nr:lactonase family protein [Enterobacillus tribolii]MBW7981646.1 lactonase family protein [Enterobacillus tribolii]RDK91025.1 6-phosphogluconolactonase (cycloisomerase 2 family) [Enterobacillus tribolii]